jgi:predicted GH43/DUF377 family glycosyl hydrolase
VSVDDLAVRQPVRLVPDPSRVVAQLFVPGHAVLGEREGRASGVIEHILELDEQEVTRTLESIMERFARRHRDLTTTFSHHADRIGNRLDPDAELSVERRLLLGATFTQEYAVEAAALCNPSLVAAPDQSNTPADHLRFVMSVRQIGEGHRSSIGFRTGLVDARGQVTVDDSGPFTTFGVTHPANLDAQVFRDMAIDSHDDREATGWVLDGLGSRFTVDELAVRLTQLSAQRDTRRNVGETIRRFEKVAGRSYIATFDPSFALSERVLHPVSAIESHGLEDARFVRFVGDDAGVVYHATYTAYDGTTVAQQLLTTTDFLEFASSPLLGTGAENKGMALFPRRMDGRYVALSRHDGARNAIAYSHDLHEWSTVVPLECPTAPWEAVQVGNCGSPIETADGWLVLTHGVGPMRVYSIGAWLLDIDDPTKVIGRLRRPLLRSQLDEQDGYVPNIVYSCGALEHRGTLVIPCGIGDTTIGFATVPTRDLLAAIHDDGPAGRRS